MQSKVISASAFCSNEFNHLHQKLTDINMEITFKKSCAKMPSIRRKQFISNFNSFQYKNQLFTNISLITMYLLLGLLIFIPTRTDSYRVFPQITIPLSVYNSATSSGVNSYLPHFSFQPKHFNLPPLSKISETMEAIGTLGRYILKKTRSPSSSSSSSQYYFNGHVGEAQQFSNSKISNNDHGPTTTQDLYTSSSNQQQTKINAPPSQQPPSTSSLLTINPEEDGELSDALYTLGRNVLGQNMTDTLVPVVQTVNTIGKFLPPLVYRDGRIILGSSSNSTNDGGTVRDVVCTTPIGNPGKCLDLSGCPSLLFDLSNLRKSLCFKSLFVPGVCCPDKPETSTRRPIQILTTQPTTTTSTTTRRPFLRPILSSSSSNSYDKTTFRPPNFGIGSNNIGSNTDCGKVESPSFRIVGGEKSTPGMWPWMAAIYLHGPKGTEFWCGGTLIAKRYIMTASHCTKDAKQKSFSPRQFTVRLGDYDLVETNDYASPETFRVAEIISHPDFSGMGFYNDVALLKLERDVEYNRFISPICLPTGRNKQNTFVGTFPIVIGWGTNKYGGREHNALQEVKLPVWSNDDCDRAYFQPITDIFLCAGLPAGGKDACQGDSGGPLMLLTEDNRWTQIGIVSFGNRCAEPGYPGVYTRITKFTDWIQSEIK